MLGHLSFLHHFHRHESLLILPFIWMVSAAILYFFHGRRRVGGWVVVLPPEPTRFTLEEVGRRENSKFWKGVFQKMKTWNSTNDKVEQEQWLGADFWRTTINNKNSASPTNGSKWPTSGRCFVKVEKTWPEIRPLFKIRFCFSCKLFAI